MHCDSTKIDHHLNCSLIAIHNLGHNNLMQHKLPSLLQQPLLFLNDDLFMFFHCHVLLNNYVEFWLSRILIKGTIVSLRNILLTVCCVEIQIVFICSQIFDNQLIVLVRCNSAVKVLKNLIVLIMRVNPYVRIVSLVSLNH
jgi:magnesium-transporting ATPase (P-type)